jgi:hypothetical protein
MAVNVSALQFQNEDFVADLVTVLDETRLDPRYLELEWTESALMTVCRREVLHYRDRRPVAFLETRSSRLRASYAGRMSGRRNAVAGLMCRRLLGVSQSDSMTKQLEKIMRSADKLPL